MLQRRPAPAGTAADCASSSSRLASRMSRHILGSLAAMRVKSRKPGPASDRKSCRSGCPVMLFISANASRCGRWLTAAKARRGLGRHAQHRQPSAVQTSWPSAAGLECALDRRQDDLRPCTASASACSTPETSLAGDRVGRHEGALAVAQHAPRGVDHVALGRAHVHDQHAGVTRWRMALSVASVAATGTASSTMSAPDTASSAEGPRRRSRPAGARARWWRATCCSRRPA
jgi:hypothetical protein